MTIFEKLKEDINMMSIQEFADTYIECSDIPDRFQCCKDKNKEWFKDFTCNSCNRA